MKRIIDLIMNGFWKGIGIALGIGATGLLAVSVTGTMNTFSSRQVVSASAINTNFASLRAAIESAPDMYMTPPVGTILAWHKNLANVPSLPEGWLECNGQVVSDSASALNGVTLPDLNNQRRFLRGNPTSGTLENSQFAQHTHLSPLQTRAPMATWTNHGIPPQVLTPNPIFGGVAGSNNPFEGINPYVSYAGSGSETRPINMSIVWIIRVR